jgi:hypothetical protein
MYKSRQSLEAFCALGQDNMTTRSPMNVQIHGRNYHYVLSLLPFSCCFILRPWRLRWYIPPKRRMTSTGLDRAISQKIHPFTLTAAAISDRRSKEILYKVSDSQNDGYDVPVVFKVNRRFWETYGLLLEGWNVVQANPHKTGNKQASHADLLLNGDMCLRNVSCHNRPSLFWQSL